MKQAEKEELVSRLFSDKILFELKILSVKSLEDRLEIINILVDKLIRNLLKSELNFLHMKDMKQFKFSLIINLLFKEIANEWLSFSEEVLQYSREESLYIIQNKSRVSFLYSLSRDYFAQYKKYFFAEISNTFFELCEVSLSATQNNTLIEYVLRSNLIKSNGISVIQSYSQLLSRVRSAKNYKSERLSRMQVKIAETSNYLEFGELSAEEKKRCKALVLHYKNEKRVLELSSLDSFDGALERVKETMIESMSQMKIL